MLRGSEAVEAVEAVEHRIVDAVYAAGAMTFDELLDELAVKRRSDDALFSRVALESALDAGLLQWIGDGVYAVPADAVRLVDEGVQPEVGARDASKRLGEAVAHLAQAVMAIRGERYSGCEK